MGHSEPRQLPAVPFGQVSLGHANLFFDQIEVIQQPFSGRRNAAVRLHRLCHQIANFDQDRFILGQPRQKLIRRVLPYSTCAIPRASCHAAPSDRR